MSIRSLGSTSSSCRGVRKITSGPLAPTSEHLPLNDIRGNNLCGTSGEMTHLLPDSRGRLMSPRAGPVLLGEDESLFALRTARRNLELRD